MTFLFSSTREWVADVAERLIDGEKVLLRTLPGMGKSYLARQLADMLGESAILVSGRDWGLRDPRTSGAELTHAITQKAEECGSAQLVFDDFSRALNVPAGQRLQAILHGLLVNSSLAENIGAFVTARWGERLHVAKAGSPLLSRLTPISPPLWRPEDIPSRMRQEEVLSLIGTSAGALAVAIGPLGEFDHRRLTDLLDLYAEQVVRMCPQRAVEFLAGRRPASELGSVELEPIQELMFDGRMHRAARDSALQATATALSLGWPTAWAECVSVFVSLLEDRGAALWVDRFVYLDVPRLRRFLIGFRSRSPVRLRLLGSNRPRDQIDVQALRALQRELDGVEFRTMTSMQYRACHDRHLVFEDNSGYAIPIAQVVLGGGEPGTAVATHSPLFPRDYKRIWNEASVLA